MRTLLALPLVIVPLVALAEGEAMIYRGAAIPDAANDAVVTFLENRGEIDVTCRSEVQAIVRNTAGDESTIVSEPIVRLLKAGRRIEHRFDFAPTMHWMRQSTGDGSWRIRAVPAHATTLTCQPGDEASSNGQPPPIAVRTLTHLMSGLCVHAYQDWGDPPNGTTVVLRGGGCGQRLTRLQFRMLRNGAIQHINSGKCLHPAGGAAIPANGTRLVLWESCSGSRLEYSFTANGSLMQRSSGKCIHPENGADVPVDETPLVLWDGCDLPRIAFQFN
jgi:hypothetical protein